MAEKSTIARPYAEAVFALAKEQKQLKAWSEMLQTAAAVAMNDDMQAMISNTNVRKDQVAKLIIDVCGNKFSAEGKNLIRLLAENRRLSLLAEIAAQYEALRAEEEKTIDAEMIAAFEVSAAQQKQIAEKLKARLGREVSLSCRVDSTLLGGAIIKAGDLVIDGSTKGQIQKLSIELAR
ncbi:MAG: F0F1 ATP synthase subunit delta [Gammaproteobacteria bacterium]|nr:F0F1 ATP synthase subunit delta [Gammaproteobacteria bacterium]